MRRFRFAPSPNGYLHLGHAYSALLNAEMAEACGGEFLLRIEDIDQGRARPEFEAAIFEDLAWFGLSWPTPVRRQSEHFAEYATAIAKLEALGLIYPAFESRSDIARTVLEKERGAAAWPRDPDGAPLYPGSRIGTEEAAARIANGDPYALRLDTAKAHAHVGPLVWTETSRVAAGETVVAQPSDWGDVVLARREMPTSYHLSVVVDDALQGITDVVRGQDLFHATAIHVLLQKLLALPQPRYHHHRLLRDETGHKLAKSQASKALRTLRQEGVTPSAIRHRLPAAS